MTSLFSSCFRGRSSGDTIDIEQQQRLNGRGFNPAKCVFCNVDSERFNIVLENEDLICFSDRSPAANQHLLVITRKHIANVQTLTREHVELVKEMQAFGEKALDLNTSKQHDNRRFGFHIPPFRSVDHLHLHCLEEPFRSSWRALKYRVASPPSPSYHKGWSWFAEWRQTCAILQDGGKVRVGRC